MGKRLVIPCNMADLPKGMDFIKETLKQKGVPSKTIAKTVLTSEEVLAKIIESASADEEKVRIDVSGYLGNLEISIRSKGAAFDAADIEKDLLSEEDDAEAEAVIRRLFNRIIKDDLNISNRNGINVAVIRVKRSPYAGLVTTIAAMFLGIITGLLMQHLLPAGVSKGISDGFFVPVYTVFMNSLKMIVGPLVFFSIAASISDFGDIKALGRIAVKIVIMYLFTSLIAVFIGYLTYTIFPIGDTSLAGAVSKEAASATLAKGDGISISIKDTLVGIVPSDIVTPFEKSDMLEIIFLAMILGLAAASLSDRYPLARELLATFNAVVSKITTVIVSFIPLIVFCSMAKMMIELDPGALLNVAVWVPVVYFGDILMIGMYCLLFLILTGLNPFTFLSKYYPAMIAAFTFASSNASLPSSMKQCDELGVSPRVYSFSLPLGATINMDGNCITLVITTLFFAKIFGIPVTGGMLFTLFASIILLSVGSPGVPGGNLICIALIVPQIGVPAESISLIMGLYPIMGMMQVCVNVTGDAMVTSIVSKREKLMDLEKFRRRPGRENAA